MAITIPIETLRQRKNKGDSPRPSTVSCSEASSPDSYVILLDESDQTARIPPNATECRSIPHRTKR